MSGEEVELDFEFSNQELANFLENFAEKIRDGQVGLSFKGREKVEIEPTESNLLELDYENKEGRKQMDLEIKLLEENTTQETGREKIRVEVV